MKFVIISLGVVGIGFLLRLIKQPHVIIYIITGVILGPSVTNIAGDSSLIDQLGSLGLVLLLFFIGMEISLPKLIANWKFSLTGTLIQILASVFAIWIIGYFLDWPLARVVTLGFVISLSSTAVVLRILEERNEMETRVGQNALGILLVQDVLIVPMMIILGYMSGGEIHAKDVVLQSVGALLIILFVIWLYKKGEIKLPFDKLLKNDHEIQVFFAFGLCFGFAAITGFFGLSTALGAFVAGMLVASSKTTECFHHSLYPLKVIFLALFFISVGLLIDLEFIWNNIGLISLLVGVVFITNNLITALTARMYKIPWGESFYLGALLSQIGEFSFVLGALAYGSGIIADFAYQVIISVISLTLLLSPFWIKVSSRLSRDKRVITGKKSNELQSNISDNS
ncbi:cation:proton antiporter [Roseivirga sp. 4D4]|uniref:cation:proton antiporter n=1 Tax=Roseivirga sp. 4D4 TaxID=1889784 RepID=UPI00147F3EB8|nr:cation:proton antiporter [Roseivirga sp. 4D4]